MGKECSQGSEFFGCIYLHLVGGLGEAVTRRIVAAVFA